MWINDFIYQVCGIYIYVVVLFYPWLKFYFPLFLGMVIYDNEFKTTENKILTKDKIEPQLIYLKTNWILHFIKNTPMTLWIQATQLCNPPFLSGHLADCSSLVANEKF